MRKRPKYCLRFSVFRYYTVGNHKSQEELYPMNLIRTSKPTAAQKHDMTALVDACRAAEPLSLSAPV